MPPFSFKCLGDFFISIMAAAAAHELVLTKLEIVSGNYKFEDGLITSRQKFNVAVVGATVQLTADGSVVGVQRGTIVNQFGSGSVNVEGDFVGDINIGNSINMVNSSIGGSVSISNAVVNSTMVNSSINFGSPAKTTFYNSTGSTIINQGNIVVGAQHFDMDGSWGSSDDEKPTKKEKTPKKRKSKKLKGGTHEMVREYRIPTLEVMSVISLKNNSELTAFGPIPHLFRLQMNDTTHFAWHPTTQPLKLANLEVSMNGVTRAKLGGVRVNHALLTMQGMGKLDGIVIVETGTAKVQGMGKIYITRLKEGPQPALNTSGKVYIIE